MPRSNDLGVFREDTPLNISRNEIQKSCKELEPLKAWAVTVWSEGKDFRSDLVTRLDHGDRGSTKCKCISSRGNLRTLEDMLQRLIHATNEVGKIAKRIETIQGMSRNLNELLNIHVHHWSGSSKDNEKGNRIIAFRNKKADWERLGDKKSLGLLAMEIAKIVRDATAIRLGHAQIRTTDFERDMMFLKDLAKRTHRLWFEAKALAAVLDNSRNEAMRYSSSFLEWMLREIVLVNSRLSRFQRLSTDVRSFKKALAQWENSADLATIKQSEAGIVQLCEDIEECIRREREGQSSADRDPPPPPYTPRDSDRRDHLPRYNPRNSSPPGQLPR